MNKSKKKVQECFFPEKERKSTPVKAASDTGSSSSLEMAIKEKVTPLLEESMEKHWGITIPQVGADISDTLKTSPLNMYVPWHLNFPEAKRAFKMELLKQELRLHRGNVSKLAQGFGLDRRSIHRAIKDLEIDIAEARSSTATSAEHQQQWIDQAIRTTLEQYKELIQPQKMEPLYREVTSLSEHIAQVLPHQEVSWKEAEQEFERQFLRHALNEEGWNIAHTAKKIKLRPETLHRKMKKLRLRKV